MTVINTNVKSLVAQDALTMNNRKLQTAMERLSTGSRINSAKDDAAGLAISTRMESQIKGLNMAIRNANDAISLTQTAEGAMDEVTSMLQRMRELAVQSSNAVNNAQDQAAMDAEYQQLASEITRVATNTTFNNQRVLDGSFAGKSFQVGHQAQQTVELSVANMSASSLGRSMLSAESLAVTGGSAQGTLATPTIAQMTFHGNDSYTFALDGVTITGTVTNNDASTLVDAINNNMRAAGKTHFVAALSGNVAGPSITVTNNLGGNVGVTSFSSVGSGKTSFIPLSGGGTTTLLDDTAALTSSAAALGVPSSPKGVTLSLAQPPASKDYTFDLNGTTVTVTNADTDATIKAKLVAILGTVNYEVLISTDTPPAGGLAQTAGVVAPAAGKFNIVAAAGYSANVTNFVGNGTPAGVKGTAAMQSGGTSAVLVDSSNKFTVADAGAGKATELSMNFTSTTATYSFEVDDVAVALTATDFTTAGGVATAIQAALNGSSAGIAGGLNSLNVATPGTVLYEVVQSGTSVTIKKAGNNDGVATGAGYPAPDSAKNLHITDFASTAAPAVASTAATYELNSVANTTIDLTTNGYGLYTAGSVEPTKMTIEVSGDGTYSFNLTDTATTGTVAIAAANVTNGSVAQLIANINAKTAQTSISAAADPNNSRAIILTRADGKKVEITNYSGTGSATLLTTPNANQGVAKLLNDDPAVNSATATTAGAAVATTAKLLLSAPDKYAFKVSDGNTVAVVRATTLAVVNTGAGVGDLKTEIDAALLNVASDITATVNATTGEFTFTNSKGGKVEILDFSTDGTGTATFTPATGQGIAKILNDNDGAVATGKAVSQVNLLTTGGSTEALAVLENAIQQVNNERSKLGALGNRLIHTVNNLSNIVTNTEASRSRIMDADYAQETAELARAQIIQQAATAMLAQANQSNMSVLSLLQ